jgi:competence protein ComEC
MVNRLQLSPVLCAALGAAAGFYFLSSFSYMVKIIVLSVPVIMICFLRAAALLNPKSRCLLLKTVYTTAFTVGILAGIAAAGAGRNVISFGIPENKITAIEGVLLEDPRIISGGKAMVSLSLRRSAAGSTRASGRGEMTVFFQEDNAFKLRESGRGTTVYAEGKLRKNSDKNGWTFSAKSMHIVKPASAAEHMRTGVRLKLIDTFEGTAFGGLSLALLVGIKDNLDADLPSLYRDAGCSYILALSGMHLAIIASLIAFFLRKPLGLKAAAVTGAAIICMYCFIVGPMPSLNRSAIMYLLGTLAVLGTIPKQPLSILGLSFLIQIIITPESGNTLSFIFSYLALAGILVIGQPLYSLLSGKVPDFLLKPLSASCGAFLATSGISVYSFGLLFPMGIITGLALVPLTSIFMIGSLTRLLLDLFSLSWILDTSLSFIYNLMEKILSIASNIPGVSNGNPFIIFAFSFTVIFLITVLEYRRRTSLLRLESFE